MSTYRATATLSGGGYGIFANWRNDFSAKNENDAKTSALQELNNIINRNTGVIFTDFKIHKLNK